jgi:hypothetical protein
MKRVGFILFVIEEVIYPEKKNEGICCCALGREAIEKSFKEEGGNYRPKIRTIY